jgi:hypothetical protein
MMLYMKRNDRLCPYRPEQDMATLLPTRWRGDIYLYPCVRAEVVGNTLFFLSSVALRVKNRPCWGYRVALYTLPMPSIMETRGLCDRFGSPHLDGPVYPDALRRSPSEQNNRF